MATVRAQRLLNNITDGTTNSTALETALGTSSIRSDFQQIVNERSKARLILAVTNSASSVGQSLTATEDFLSSAYALKEFALNPSKIGQYFGPSIAASNSLMNIFTGNSGNLLAATNNRLLGSNIYTSSFSKNYASRFITGAGATSAWNLPVMTKISTISTGNTRPCAINGSTIIWSFDGTPYNNSNVLQISTDGGLTSSFQKIDAGNSQSIRDLSYGNGLYIACGDASTLYRSTDGTTWTAAILSGNHSKVRYANGRWILMGQSTAYYSTDGISWSVATGSTPGSPSLDLQYIGNDTWICVYNSTNILRSTNNGASWSVVGAGATNYCLASDNAGNVVVGSTSGEYRYSTNYGASWSSGGVLNGLNSAYIVYGAAFYGGTFIFNQNTVSNMSYLRTVGGTSYQLSVGVAAGINPVPSLGAVNAASNLRVIDGRLTTSIDPNNFYVNYVGQ